MPTSATLTEQYILDILCQESKGAEFPVDFDDIWQSSGYTEKKNAVRFLTKRLNGLKKGKHYQTQLRSEELQRGIRPSHSIRMTYEAYRFFLAKSNTPQGDANLWYLIEVESKYRQSLERQLSASSLLSQALEVVEPAQRIVELEQKNKELKRDLDFLKGVWTNTVKENLSLEAKYQESALKIEGLEEEIQDLESELEGKQKECNRLYEENYSYYQKVNVINYIEEKAIKKRLMEQLGLNWYDHGTVIEAVLGKLNKLETDNERLYEKNLELVRKLDSKLDEKKAFAENLRLKEQIVKCDELVGKLKAECHKTHTMARTLSDLWSYGLGSSVGEHKEYVQDWYHTMADSLCNINRAVKWYLG